MVDVGRILPDNYFHAGPTLRFDGLTRPSEPASHWHNVIVAHLTKVTS